ncbi:MAG: ribokinase [Pseudomonadota bacterium]|nr:ribokinase [Pseudomonadota bacterium]
MPRLPHAGETVAAHALHIEPGGKGLNVAIGLKRLGIAVHTLIGCGTDAAGSDLLALLAREGIDTRHVHRFDGPSGWGAGLIGADGENVIAVFAGANAALEPAHVTLAQEDVRAAQLVYGQLETSLGTVQAAFELAHTSGVMTVLNPSPWCEMPPELSRHTHTLIVNQSEAAHLLGLSSPLADDVSGAVHALRQWLPGLRQYWPALQRLVLTLGANGSLGCEAVDGGWRGWHVPAPRVRVLDTVGAGDAFACGYCAAVLAGEPLAAALRWGNLCGAHMVQQHGVLAALPGKARLTALRRRPLTSEPIRLSETG